MHELTMIQQILGLIDGVVKEHQLVEVTRVRLQIGRLRQVVPSTLRFAFRTLSEGTCVQGAHLDVDYIPITVHCRDCEKTFEVKEQAYICPCCQGCNLEIVTGKELILETVEGET